MKVGFISLGCPKNLVDTEVMMGQLVARGHHQLTSHAEEAGVIVVGTCSFNGPTQQASLVSEGRLAARALRTYSPDGRQRRILVMGP